MVHIHHGALGQPYRVKWVNMDHPKSKTHVKSVVHVPHIVPMSHLHDLHHHKPSLLCILPFLELFSHLSGLPFTRISNLST